MRMLVSFYMTFLVLNLTFDIFSFLDGSFNYIHSMFTDHYSYIGDDARSFLGKQNLELYPKLTRVFLNIFSKLYVFLLIFEPAFGGFF
jgi:hypothetical protein